VPRFVATYPFLPTDRVTLRGEPDWGQDLEPTAREPERAVFDLPPASGANVRELKVVLHRDGAAHWSVGANYVLRDGSERVAHPVFFQGEGRVTGHLELPSAILGEPLRLRLFLPAGYDENTTRRYAVVYAMDGANLFDPTESFGGHEWKVDETVALLDRMAVIDRVMVVGIYARHGRREHDYTRPGYDALLRALAEEVVPRVDAAFRTRAGAGDRAVLGSSLGGVFAMHAWLARPEVFGHAASMSSTFGYADDLFVRVAAGPLPAGRIYLDAGYPNDNFVAVRKMAHALADRGANLRYVAHPRGLHSELHWADRLHLPLQYLFAD
jgi:predicted alpha/beta superfamily hydrolase